MQIFELAIGARQVRMTGEVSERTVELAFGGAGQLRGAASAGDHEEPGGRDGPGRLGKGCGRGDCDGR